jgi:putative membrane protein insertion efficiency factor
MKNGALRLIRLYQKWLSFDTGILRLLFPNMGTCRFSPRCSEYMYQAVERYGMIKGLSLGFRRILRCNGFFAGGVDPLP